MGIILFSICIIACIIGAISGIGGGIIIKPLIDSISIMDMKTLGFLSGCTVMCMSAISLYKNRKVKIDYTIPIFLSIGACIGGVVGKKLFDFITGNFINEKVGLIQSILLLLINIFILWYMFVKPKIKSKQIKSKIVTIFLGILLGIISSFLSIGGGPLNIALIYYCYSLDAKKTTTISLIVVFFSQLASLVETFLTGVPPFSINHLLFMCLGGVLGGLIGGILAQKISNKTTQKIFIYILLILIGLNIFNIIKFYNI